MSQQFHAGNREMFVENVCDSCLKAFQGKRRNTGLTIIFLQLLVKHGMAKERTADEKDRRHCVLCSQSGDGDTNGTAR